MEIVNRKLADIHPYPNNPRKNDEAVADVVESIKQCGHCDPIEVDETGVILSGHTRLKALKKLGWKEVEVVVISGLTEEQIMAMDDQAAVWYAFRYGGCVNVICAKGAKYHYQDHLNEDTGNYAIYFSAKPTAADIEAARGEGK